MKRFLFLAIFIIFLIFPGNILATRGCCSSHDGVNCSAGAQSNGNVICNDGWTGSSCSYSSMIECGGSYQATTYTPTPTQAPVVTPAPTVTAVYIQKSTIIPTPLETPIPTETPVPTSRSQVQGVSTQNSPTPSGTQSPTDIGSAIGGFIPSVVLAIILYFLVKKFRGKKEQKQTL